MKEARVHEEEENWKSLETLWMEMGWPPFWVMEVGRGQERDEEVLWFQL